MSTDYKITKGTQSGQGFKPDTAKVQQYADFARAMAKGEVFTTLGGDELLPVSKGVRKRNYTMPSFDFGHLLDEGHPHHLGDYLKEIAPDALTEFMDINGQDGMVFGERGEVTHALIDRAFIYWFQGERRLVIDRAPERQVVHGVASMVSYTAGYGFDRAAGFWVRVAGEEWVWKTAMLAMKLLDCPKVMHADSEDRTATDQFNSRAKVLGKPRLPVTQSVFLSKVVKSRTSGPNQGGTHASPRPHDRAGYTYTRNGKTITVKGPIEVKGGEIANTSTYRVKPGPLLSGFMTGHA